MHFYRKCWFDLFMEQFISLILSDCPSLMLGIAIHCIHTAFSSNVWAWGMWACSLFLHHQLLLKNKTRGNNNKRPVWICIGNFKKTTMPFSTNISGRKHFSVKGGGHTCFLLGNIYFFMTRKIKNVRCSRSHFRTMNELWC